MKNILALVLITASLSTFAQSESFLTLKEKFGDSRNVTSISVGGFILRTALLISGEDHYRDEFGDVSNVRLINIPIEELDKRNLKISGFKKVLRNDNFEEVVSASEDGEHVTIYMQERKRNKNLYFLLIEGEDQILAIEIKGYLDPKKLLETNSKDRLTSL
ncbi:DUF4252 domain-containing protein [Ohtaekwangia koreensis]|uniref:DUF4252 domain-containing protein n=1 Tax=Ohtaekwangia koreensis TaxID=688867 RepID=A0A1T5LS07_9BACT|nr:DUF4252 domain-containing protein [Ohtaekwangia koreensis]SKC78710.1 protein of unknown function [Ohtaekwangia koreensis]